MVASKKPRVSIGFPVYNGENYLEGALNSLLSQTFSDFEIVISDNASTDRTAEVCQAYAAKDARIKYSCNEGNIGARKNWNRVFALSKGEYFNWTAHDDKYAPQFLQKCVEILDGDSSIVLCYARAKIIDKDGRVIGTYDRKMRTASPKPHVRFHDLIFNEKCFEIFGVIRADALRKTPVIGGFGHADGVLLTRLGLMGRFHEIPEYLFFNRDHPQKSLYQYSTYRDYAVWYEPSNRGKILLPRWRMGFEYVKCVTSVPLRLKERFLCLLQMGSWVARFWESLAANVLFAGWQLLRLPVQKIKVKHAPQSSNRDSHIKEKIA
ncbi:MAG: glycosyltransferase family 2 protein [Bacteroidota bacterium]